ncbi:trigger factor [Synechococcus sp. PCC 7502]|uniref:trigger factor n=1 Tax=Synechococcus sp. PCC 7502 TaxID=1173263 RepID=UPI00029FCBD6|nr:trigger factor [Synechococcus sp. PCC 7502]AFY74926.1 trigger factor [Synechococcus sp. PCC 7502]
MKVTVEKLPASQVSFDIEIEGEKSQAVYDRSVKQLSQSVNVPGFRKGKAPRELVLRQIGKDKLKANILEEVLQNALNEVIKEHSDIQAIGSFDLGTSFEDLFSTFVIGAPLQFKASIDVHPEVELKQYKDLSVKAEQVDPDLTQADKTLHEYQIRKSTVVPVEDRAIAIDDLVTIDFKVLDAAGNEIENATENGFVLSIETETDEFIDGVAENLIGVNLGETKEIVINLPEGYFNPGQPEQPATFIATVTDIKARELPELDDEFAKSISAKETIAELRAYLEQRAIDEAKAEAEANINKALINAVVENMAEVELPSTMINRESERIVQQQLEWLTQTPEGEKLAKQLVTKEFVQNLISSNQPEAIIRIKKSLAIAEIARLENITVPRADVIDGATKLSQEVNDKSIDFELLKQVTEDEILTTKVVEWLKANSTIEIVPAGSLQLPEPEADAEVDTNVDIEVESQTVEVEVLAPDQA